MREHPSCCVVGDISCDAPANYDGPPRQRLLTCYRCGDRVCRRPGCSLLVTSIGRYGRRSRHRECTNCARQWYSEETVRAMINEATAKETR